MNRHRFLAAWVFGVAALDVLLYATLNERLHAGHGAIVRAFQPWLSDGAKTVIFAIGTTVLGGLVGYASAVALAVPQRARRISVLSLAAVAGLIAAVNLYLSGYPLPDEWYTTTTRISSGAFSGGERTTHWNPWMVHLMLTLPVAGAVTGAVLMKLGSTTSPSIERIALAAVAWAAAFSVGGVVAYFANYLVVGITIDAFEALRLPAAMGHWIGVVAAGLLSGVVVGSAGRASLVHGPTASRSLAESA